MSTDRETLDVYGKEAERYAAHDLVPQQIESIDDFAARLPKAGRILDIGCGPGAHAKMMQDKGFDVTGWDASPEFVDMAQARGVTTLLRTYDDLVDVARFDGIWSSFSLLHTPKSEHGRYIAAMARALRKNGHIVIGMKLGEGEARDHLGRFYAYVTRDELEKLCDAAGLRPVATIEGTFQGMAGQVEPYILLTCRRDA